jgi:hypothetical protein
MRRGAFAVALSALERAATLSGDGRSRGTRLLRAAEVANELGQMDAIGRLLADAEPIDVAALEDRRRAWVTALSLTGPRSPREGREPQVGRRRREAPGRRRPRRSRPRPPPVRLGPQLVGGARRRDPVGDRGCRDGAGTHPDDARVLFMRAVAPEGHIDYVLEHLRQTSSAPVSGPDRRRYATAALWVGALDLAVDYYTVSIADLRETGRLGLLARSLITRAFSSVHVGTLATVASDLDEGLRLGIETRQPFYVTTAHVAQSIYLAFRGDIDGAEARIRDAEQVELNAPAGAALAETRHARGIIEIAAGRYDDAYEQLRHLFDPEHPSYQATVAGWAVSDFADAASKTGHVAEGEEVVRFLEADTVRMKMPLVEDRRRLRPVGPRRPGCAQLGGRRRRRVRGGAGDGPRPLAAREGPTLPGVRDLSPPPAAPAESRAELRAARDLFDAIGVRYLADRAQRELGASGEASRHRASTSSTS